MKNIEKRIVMVAMILSLVGVQNSYGAKGYSDPEVGSMSADSASNQNALNMEADKALKQNRKDARKQLKELNVRLKDIRKRTSNAELSKSEKRQIAHTLKDIHNTLMKFSKELPKDSHERIEEVLVGVDKQRQRVEELDKRLLALEKSKPESAS